MNPEQPWKEILESAAQALHAVIYTSWGEAVRFNRKSVSALRPYLPYCLRKVDDENFIWLNRDYKLLGIIAEWSDYRFFPWLHVKKEEPVAAFGDFWLFGDGSAPWLSRAYTERLIQLLIILGDSRLDMRAPKIFHFIPNMISGIDPG